MDIPLSQAKGRLLELVRRMEAGEDVVLTRRGQAIARLVAAGLGKSAADRRAAMNVARAAARHKIAPGPSAAHSADFLYGDDGLPG